MSPDAAFAAFLDRSERLYTEDPFYRRELLSEGSLALDVRWLGDRSPRHWKPKGVAA